MSSNPTGFVSNITFAEPPQHTSSCEEFWAEGMRCHCQAWFWENGC